MTAARAPHLSAMAALAALAAGAQAPAPAHQFAAPRPPEILRSMHLAGRNQLGILEYCRAQGAVGEDVVALHRRALAALPPAQVEGLEAAEDAGRRGIIAFDGSEAPLAAAASGQGVPVAESCRALARTVQAQAGLQLR